MKDVLSIDEYIQAHAHQVESELMRILPQSWNIPHKLREAMNYSLMAGGKRLRPILVIAAAEAVGYHGKAALHVACAVELIHTYSLIHDDLPAMDNDDYRRGKLTNHKVYGEAMAILAGDALLTHAFSIIAQAKRLHGISSEAALSVLEEMSVFAGAKGMVGGQAADMLGEQGIAELSDLEYIHTHKTADLIAFSLKAGGRIGGANAAQLDALETFGSRIGLAFQIQDDILDVTGDEAKLGKKTNSDEKHHKVTYPYFLGLEASIRLVEELTRSGKEAILQADFDYPTRLLQLADYLMARDY